MIRDYRTAGLEPAEVAMIAYVKKVARDAHAVTEADVAVLRDHGFTDEEVLDIAMVTAARVFFGTIMDAVGAVPDDDYLNDGGLMDMLDAAGIDQAR